MYSPPMTPRRRLALLCFALVATLGLASCAPTPTPEPTPVPPGIGSAPTPTLAPPFPWTAFDPGSWRVGEEIVPGVYEAANASGSCEWARLRRVSDADADILFAGRADGPVRVAIPSTDAGFSASRSCGRWMLQPPPAQPTPLVPIPVPPGFPKPGEAATISSGGWHTCALRTDGGPVCWGGNSDLVDETPGGERFSMISSGTSHVCALRFDGSPVCWGWDGHGQASPPEGERFATISSGHIHTCAVRLSGSPVCWGSNDEDGYDRLARQATPPNEELLAEVIGQWERDMSRLCPGATEEHPACVAIIEYDLSDRPDSEQFTLLDRLGPYTCAKREDRTNVCWGHYANGEPAPISGVSYTAVSSGGFNTLALRADGVLVSWGQAFIHGHGFTTISNGKHHECALRPDGSSQCWGKFSEGQLWAPGGEKFAAITVGEYNTCALRFDGGPVCWGGNHSGEAEPPEQERFVAITAGAEHVCGLRPDGAPICWGDNNGIGQIPEGERFAIERVQAAG